MPGTRIDPSTLAGRPCSVASALELVGDRWALLAVREVGFGNHQFSRIARNTGAPSDRLAARLKDLVAAGVLERRTDPDVSRHVGYYLTEAGHDLSGVIRELLLWGDRWAVTEAPMRLRHHDHPLDRETICATCGEVVDTRDTRPESASADWDLAGPVARKPSATPVELHPDV